jgi:hypothetical protein
MVSGSAVRISAAASDNIGVAGVQFKLDGTNLGSEVTAAPYTVTWNTTNASDGSHTLTALARDAAGNQTTSTPVTVSVNNSIPDSGAPPNDIFADAKVLSGSSGSVGGGNGNATKETGEPNHAGDTGGHSVWYRWTAGASVTVTIDTIGSSFDTLLAVYTGSSVSGLTPVVSNDDISSTTKQSRVSFTPTAGLPMSTRSGDLDPALAWYMASVHRLKPKQFHRMVNHESGLLGISELSSDMRELADAMPKNIRAAEAVELFCYQAKKWIGSYAAALGGLDTLVFSGGIGENGPEVRERICAGLGFLGIEIDPRANAVNAEVISAPGSRVCVRVIRTDEEFMIAKSVCEVLGIKMGKE